MDPTPVSDAEPSLERSPERLLQLLSSATEDERWCAACDLAHAIDVGRADGAQYRAACVPVLIEILERHDEHTPSPAETAARRLVEIGERTGKVRGSMTRCLRRAQDALMSLEAALAAHEDSASPAASALLARVGSSRSLVISLQGYLENFQESPLASFAPLALTQAVTRRSRGGWLGLIAPLFALLVIGSGLLAYWVHKKAGREVTLNAALPALDRAGGAASVTPQGGGCANRETGKGCGSSSLRGP